MENRPKGQIPETCLPSIQGFCFKASAGSPTLIYNSQALMKRRLIIVFNTIGKYSISINFDSGIQKIYLQKCR
jgi:hypothetical protein